MRRENLWKVLGVLVVTALAGVALYLLPFKLGLDLKGGVHVVLEGQNTPQVKVDADVMQRAKNVIERRVNGLGVSEPVIQVKGNNQIIVDLPGIRDQQKAIEVIGKTAQLEFRDPQGNVVVSGAQLIEARLSQDSYGRPAVSFRLNSDAAARFGAMTSANIGKQAPIVLDNEVISDPVIQGAITGGEGQITGNFTMDEAKRLVTLLNAGALPVPLKVVENRSVGPSLGKDTIDASLRASMIAIALVLFYMFLYYRVPGLLADLALGIYMVLLMGALVAIHATLTLPGIAGLILSVGMAVDANVLIFERIKEELFAGKHLRAAIDSGFHRAFSSIFDSNATTLVSGIVLFIFGTGPIKGFAVTLSIGIVISMFTAITVSKLLLTLLVDRDPDKYVRLFGVRG